MKQQSAYSPTLLNDINSNEMVDFFYKQSQEPSYTEIGGLYNIPLSYLCTVNSKVNNTSILSLLRMAVSR